MFERSYKAVRPPPHPTLDKESQNSFSKNRPCIAFFWQKKNLTFFFFAKKLKDGLIKDATAPTSSGFLRTTHLYFSVILC